MDTLNALILGIVQGLAEYLPISSSGHLEICKDILGMDMTGAESLEFDLVLHVATVLSTIVVLWHEFVPLCKSFFLFKNDDNTIYVWKIILSCIPVAIVGFCFKDLVKEMFEGRLDIVGICLCVTALLLTFSYYYRRPGKKNAPRGHKISWLDAFVMGIAQAVAVLPGLSRSGSTIATGMLLGCKRENVARFSFFMVIIPILGEALLNVKNLLFPSADTVATAEPMATIGIVPLIVGFIASFVVGCIACKWMLNLVKNGKLVWFALYCLVVGAICIVYSVA